MKEKNEQEAEVNESRLKSQLAAGTADNRKTSSLVMFTNVSVEVIVFTLTLLSILVLNQQPLGEKPMPDGISCNPSLSVCGSWSSGLQRIPPVWD